MAVVNYDPSQQKYDAFGAILMCALFCDAAGQHSDADATKGEKP